MAEHNVHAVFVDGLGPSLRAHEHLVQAFITDQDLMRAISSGRLDAEAGESTTSQMVTVRAEDSLEKAAEVMGDERCSHLIVVSGDRPEPLGVLSSLDIARALASDSAASGSAA